MITAITEDSPINTSDAPNNRNRIHEYDLMVPDYHGDIICSPITNAELETTFPMVEAFFGDSIASKDTVAAVLERQRLSVWVMRDAKTGVCGGCYAMLFLNKLGAQLAAEGQFDARAPKLEWLAGRGETPEAVYKWLIVAKGRAYAGIAAVAAFMCQPRFAKLDYFATALTEDGARFIERYGFERLSPTRPIYRYRRLANRAA